MPDAPPSPVIDRHQPQDKNPKEKTTDDVHDATSSGPKCVRKNGYIRLKYKEPFKNIKIITAELSANDEPFSP